jgi:hypothetical protein
VRARACLPQHRPQRRARNQLAILAPQQTGDPLGALDQDAK